MKTALQIIQKRATIIMVLIGSFIMINPVAAHMKNLHHWEEEQQEMWSDQSNSLVDINPEAGKQKNTEEVTTSEDIKTILIVFLSLIGIAVTCFLVNVLGKVIEEHIYSSIAGN